MKSFIVAAILTVCGMVGLDFVVFRSIPDLSIPLVAAVTMGQLTVALGAFFLGYSTYLSEHTKELKKLVLDKGSRFWTEQ